MRIPWTERLSNSEVLKIPTNGTHTQNEEEISEIPWKHNEDLGKLYTHRAYWDRGTQLASYLTRI